VTTDAAPAGTLVTIVEDDPAIAEGLALNLRLQGHRTETVGDAETALARISEAAPALVLLDITLPKQSGLWVLERLRESNNHVPVIVLSARQDEFDKVAALRLGADDYVTKPFTLAELLARVASLLRRSRLGRGPAPGEAPAPPAANADATPPDDAQVVRFGDVVVDRAVATASLPERDRPFAPPASGDGSWWQRSQGPSRTTARRPARVISRTNDQCLRLFALAVGGAVARDHRTPDSLPHFLVAKRQVARTRWLVALDAHSASPVHTAIFQHGLCGGPLST